MSQHASIGLLLMACMALGGCNGGNSDLGTGGATPAAADAGDPDTLDGWIAKAPGTELVEHNFTLADVEYSLMAPGNAIIDKEGEHWVDIQIGEGGIRVTPESGIEYYRRVWTSPDSSRSSKRFLLDTPTAILVETDAEPDINYASALDISVGDSVVGISSNNPKDVADVSLDNALLGLKCAKTIAVK